ncbi:MAG: ATP-dependent DNA ligase [Myxococcales bacterium]|nr:ATP-dependent DNA ligase [Myxococcales bacterium]
MCKLAPRRRPRPALHCVRSGVGVAKKKTSGAKRARASQTLELGGRSIKLTSQTAVMFPADAITKGDLVAYYRDIAEVMLPHVRGRPLTVQRFSKGIDGKGFMQKQASDHYPDWIPRAHVPSKSGRGNGVDHPVCDEAAALVYLANQRCVTLHITSARADKLEHPDQVIFDFDPPDGQPASFERVRIGAGMLGELLDELGLVPFLKTSGSRGLHVIAPIERDTEVDDVRAFARSVCEWMAREQPKLFTTEMSKKARGDRVFLDYLRNGYAQTVVAAYSVRPLAGAPVSTPLVWDELSEPGLHAQTYTLKSVRERLGRRQCPWADFHGRAVSLEGPRAALTRRLS